MTTVSFLVGLCIIATSSMLPVASAWGKDGHEMVGNVAWRLISNRTRIIVEQILGDTSDDDPSLSPLAAVADWADQARYSQAYHWSAPLHYMDVQDGEIPGGCPITNETIGMSSCQLDYPRDCVDDVCVAGSIVNYTQRLVKHMSFSNDPVPLKFLVHFVGDIHQPLHAARASDRGGNDLHVHFLEQETSKTVGRRRRGLRSRLRHHHHHHSKNLHSVWDDDIIEKSLQDDFDDDRTAFEDVLYQILKAGHASKRWNEWLACPDGGLRTCTLQWGEESLDYALEYAYRNEIGSAIQNDDVLSIDYYTSRLPIVQKRLAVAGLRLAVTLEAVLSRRDYDNESTGRNAVEFLRL